MEAIFQLLYLQKKVALLNNKERFYLQRKIHLTANYITSTKLPHHNFNTILMS